MLRVFRYVGALVALAVLAALIVFAVRESPSYQQCIGDTPHEESSEQKKESTAGFLGMTIVRSRIIWRCTGHFIDKNDAGITAVGTIIIAAFTTILGIFTISLARSTRIAANAADMSARAALALELPIINAEPVGFGFGVAQEGDKPRTEHFGIQCFEFANQGRTKAFPIEVRWGWTA